MSDSSKAVFLSYASQDAEAARRISESLRAAGVEVWFDTDGGLEHGDEWDAKIRRQIKECVLFIPIISANTEARHEGYFRIEWDLAAERARGIASGVPFILPVVIDDTRETQALVPDRFRAVQWTRLRDGVVSLDVTARLVKLWSHRVGVLSTGANRSSGAELAHPTLQPERTPLRRRWVVLGSLAAIGLIVAAFVAWKIPRRDPASARTAVVATTPTGPVTEADRLIARAAATFDRMNYTREDLAAADMLARKATELAPESAEAWAMRAFVQAAYVWRLWDRSDKRRQEVESLANRALAFDPKQVRALLALAELHLAQRAFAQSEVVARRAIALRPDDPHLFRVLAGALDGQERDAEAAAVREKSARRFPRDALTHYGLGNTFMRVGDFAAALQSFDAALAIEPFASALLNKARVLVAWKGDLVGARQVLDQIAPQDRTELRAVGVAMWQGLLERRLDRVQDAAALTAQTYLELGPKATVLAMALHLAGKQALAQQQWQAAEAVARQRLREQPGDMAAAAHVAIALVWQGRAADAAREITLCEATVLERPAALLTQTMWVARYYASLGDAAKAVSFLRLANSARDTTESALTLDPWWDQIRDRPEFAALMAEAKVRVAAGGGSMVVAAAAAAPAPDVKSVAVLPFANRSDDREAEYFSDGISEDLLNELGKVPGLRVAGWTSALSLKGKNASAREIGEKLGVAHVVDGSVRKVGSRIQIHARLTNAASNEQLWSEAYVDESVDIIALQQKIARDIAQKLRLTLGDAARRVRAVNPEAHRLMLEGRYFLALRNSGFPAAERAFTEALRLAPDFAEAHAGLAAVHVLHASYRWSEDPATEEEIQKGGASARRAIALDASLVQAHAVLAYQALLSGRLTESAQSFERALALNPHDAQALNWHGHLLARLGRLDEALAANERAVQIDPLSFSTLFVYARQLTYARQHAKALEMARRSVALRSDFTWSRGIEAVNLLALGRVDEASAVAREIRREQPEVGFGNMDGIWVLQQAKHGDEAAAWVEEIRRDASVPATQLRRMSIALGKFEEVLSGRQKLTAGPFDVAMYFWYPIWDPVRNDPRFQQRLAELGLAAHYDVARKALARLEQQQSSQSVPTK
jgi:TolB-like protein/Tfp pilus assembly protein PilF